MGRSGICKPFHDACRLVVERDRAAGLCIEHRDAHWRALYQGFEVGACTLLGLVGARVGYDGGRLRRKQQQDFLVLVGEALTAFLFHEIEVAYVHTTMAHRGALEGAVG